jgi:hypothetical protein
VRRALRRAGVQLRTTSESAALHRCGELNDAIWLADRYDTSSTEQIARELNVNNQQVLGALRRLGISVRRRDETQRRQRPVLHDPVWLRQRVDETSVTEVAKELGISVVGIQAALRRQGEQSPYRYNAKAPMASPAPDVLEQWWQAEETIKGVARRGEVSVNTAAVWLAQVGIFVNDTPALTRRDLKQAIADGDSIDQIRRRHAVADRTVLVELHRHGLFAEHRRHHLKR